MTQDELLDTVKTASTQVYDALKAGYNETVYEEAMGVELRLLKITYEIERTTEVMYKVRRSAPTSWTS